MQATPSYLIGRTAAGGLVYDLAIRSSSFQLSHCYAWDDIYVKVREELKAMPPPMTVTIEDTTHPGLAVQLSACTADSMSFANCLLNASSAPGYTAHIKDIIGPGWSQHTETTEIKAEHRFIRYTSGSFMLPGVVNSLVLRHGAHLDNGDESMAYIRNLLFPKRGRAKRPASYRAHPQIRVVIHVDIKAMDVMALKLGALTNLLREFGKAAETGPRISYAARLLKMMDASPTFFRTRFIATNPVLSRCTDAEIRKKLQSTAPQEPHAPPTEHNDPLLLDGARAFNRYKTITDIESYSNAAMSILEHLVWADIYNQYVTAWNHLGPTIRTDDALSVLDRLDCAMSATNAGPPPSDLKLLHRFLSSLT